MPKRKGTEDTKNPLVRPSGWKATGSMYGDFWTKPSKYGLRYMCPECGKKALGTTFRNDSHHHWPKCSRMVPNSGSRQEEER